MATTYGDTVNAYYLAYYGRPADPAGLAYWISVLEKSNGDASSIVSAFAASAEATSRFGGASASDRISDVYQQLFGRAPDKAGLDYWVKAIESGQLSVANAAIEIMHGAQKADEQTSTLRQQVAAEFTAEVKASGVAYDGAAAIEAARVLISAVNADSKPADIASLVKAGASLVQTAHDNPDVIKALANGGDLSAVLNTASGKADPVGVVQALASIGKAALTDSAGLSSLLQGGGMSGLLNSLPAGTSVKDVAAAVSSGGLSAGADVAKPPVDVPAEPPVAVTPTIAFVGADGKDLPADTTLVANSIWYFIDVHGMSTGAKAVFEYATAASPTAWQAISEDIPLPDGAYFVRYTVTDAAGNSGTSNALKLVMDHTVPFLNMALVEDTGASNADHVSSKGAVKISGLHANEAWFYSFDGRSWTSGTTDANGVGAIAAPATDGVKNLTVRTLETVDGKSQFTSTAFRYTLDTVAPTAPVLALAVDSGTSQTDHITNNSAIKVSGLTAGATWEFSYDKGAHWTPGTSPVVNGSANLDTGASGAQTVMVRSTDAAGNVSATSSIDYTAYKYLSGLLGVTGKYGPEITSNTQGLQFNVMLAGHTDGVTTAYQVSSTGLAADFKAWDPSQNTADGTYYFRAVGSDLAGNAYTSNVLTVHLDNTAPPAPTGVKLQSDSGIAGDGITDNGNFVVSGLQKDVLWQYSSDGTTWYQGMPADADGNATGYAQSTGEQTLRVRTYDLAGNTSEAVTLHFTLDNHLNALNLTLNGANPTSHLLQTSASAPDLVFSYTGTINAGDTFDYTPEYMGDGSTVWTKIDGAMIDTVNKTITLHNFDLSTGDVFLTLRGSDAAGTTLYQASVDGPYTSTFAQYSASGAKFVLSAQATAKLYLTDSGKAPVQLLTDDASGGLVGGKWVNVGAQSNAVQGVAGAGNDASILTALQQASGKTFAFGTTGGDNLSGTHVWGFGGDDTINAAGTDQYNSAMVSGGMGADAIHTETSSSQLMYASSAESFLAADDAVAHGFDTVYLSNGVPTSYTNVLNFEDVKLGDFYGQLVGAANFSGSETGNALLAALETAVTGSFKTGQSLSQAALVSFGNDGNGHAVNFLVVDSDKDGHVGSGDYIVEIVGSIGSSSVSYEHGMVFFNTLSVPV
jgi:hypothetical protein